MAWTGVIWTQAITVSRLWYFLQVGFLAIYSGWAIGYDLGMEFEWDESKAAANLKKHGVSFEEAKTVFDNVLAVIFDDEAHSVGERREIIIGHSRNNRLLLISFAERSNTIRIISVRLATRREREDYEQNAF